MKKLLYIGNQLSQKDKTVTTIDTLSKLLYNEGYDIVTASSKINKGLRLVDMLRHVIKYRNKVDFVLIDTYSTSNFYYAYLCSLLCRLLKLKYLPILHGGKLPVRLENSPKLSKSIFNNSYKNIAPSEYIKSSFENLGYSNIKVIPNSIEIDNYKFQQRKIVDVRLLWVRSFTSIYNPNLAIEVLFKLKQQDINALLCMVGPDNDGSLEKAREYAQELNVEVKFTGKLSKSEWIELSTNYNIFINTTNFDNMPVSVIEAMALGLPIISTNVGGIPFLIENEKDGLLINPNDADLFVETIIKIRRESKDCNEMVSNARRTVELFDWETVKQKWFKVLK